MDSHPKKKKKKNYRANQKSNRGHVVGRDQYSLYSIQSKSKPNPITQHYNTEVFIKKNTIYQFFIIVNWFENKAIPNQHFTYLGKINLNGEEPLSHRTKSYNIKVISLHFLFSK